MNVGIIGLGRMGLAIAARLLQANFTVLGFDPDATARKNLTDLGGTQIDDITQLPEQTNIIWLMVPAGKIVDDVITQLKPHLKPKTILIDGGNSHFPDTINRAKELEKDGFSLLDCGTSGGVRGREIGFSLMIGGDKKSFEKAEKIFAAIATPNGYAHLGPAGAGHYVKMIHNGIEYAILQSYADGFNLLKHGEYNNLDLHKIATVWNNGSVIRSWICELIQEIFEQSQEFTKISGKVGENLTGQWTLLEANKQNISMDLLQAALKTRKWSRETGGNYATKLIALLRKKFGGHQLADLK